MSFRCQILIASRLTLLPAAALVLAACTSAGPSADFAEPSTPSPRSWFGMSAQDAAAAIGCTGFIVSPADNQGPALGNGACTINGMKIAVTTFADASTQASAFQLARSLSDGKPRRALYFVEAPGLWVAPSDGSEEASEALVTEVGGGVVNLKAP